VPEQATQFHLELLSELAQMLSEKNFRESLLQAETSSDLHRLMVNWEPNRAAA
jgi:PTS system nitrogen regulatory IIA component